MIWDSLYALAISSLLGTLASPKWWVVSPMIFELGKLTRGKLALPGSILARESWLDKFV